MVIKDNLSLKETKWRYSLSLSPSHDHCCNVPTIKIKINKKKDCQILNGVPCAPPTPQFPTTHLTNISTLLTSHLSSSHLFSFFLFFSLKLTHSSHSLTFSNQYPLHTTIIFLAKLPEKLLRNLCIFTSFIWGKNF